MTRSLVGYVGFAVAWTPILALVVFAAWALLSGLAHFEAVTFGSEYLIDNTGHEPHFADELRDTVEMREEFGLEPAG